MKIYPTHRCFDDVLDYLEALVTSGEVKTRAALDAYAVVHGICIAPDNEPYAHAWIEHGDDVWQGGIIDGERVFYGMPRTEFFEQRRVREFTRYSMAEVLRHNLQSGHYGPWEKAYRALCATKGEEHKVWECDAEQER